MINKQCLNKWFVKDGRCLYYCNRCYRKKEMLIPPENFIHESYRLVNDFPAIRCLNTKKLH